MATSNAALLLTTGINGEVAARAAEVALEFTRVEIGDANGTYPVMDKARTALINKVIDGEILSHNVDPDTPTQRIIELNIPPIADFNAVEMMVYAKYGNNEFPHTYIRLAAPFPVRVTGSQATLKQTIALQDASSEFKIFVPPDLTYVTHSQLRAIFNGISVYNDANAITTHNQLHVFKAQADLQIPDDAGGSFRVIVAEEVNLINEKCRVLAPQGSDSMRIDGDLADVADILQKGIVYQFIKSDGVWYAWSV